MRMKVEYWPLEKFIAYARNARVIPDSAVGKVAASIKEFGFKNPILVTKDGVIIAGHTRLLAAQRLGLDDAPVIVCADLNDAKAKALRLADNRTGQEATWDMELLGIELEDLAGLDIDLSLTGFDAEELLDLNGDAAGPIVEDEAPEPPDDPITKPGDLWLLGEHRVLCGDCTDAASYVLLMQGRTASLTLTDPPYNVDLGYSDYDDDRSDDEYEQFCRAWFALVREHSERQIVTPGLVNLARWVALEVPRFTAPWTKTNSMTNGSVSRFMCWEPVLFYGESWPRSRANDVFDFAVGQQKDVGDHPCPKPLKMWADIVENYSEKGGVVLDVFCGAGTAVSAAEQTGRICYGMEIDPRYCDVIVTRWENLTGKKATLVP